VVTNHSPPPSGCIGDPYSHTAAMDVLAAGGTLTEAMELLGHVYTVTTMTYAKVDLASLRELVVPFGQVPR
jgi:site-specific recombinase XerD